MNALSLSLSRQHLAALGIDTIPAQRDLTKLKRALAKAGFETLDDLPKAFIYIESGTRFLCNQEGPIPNVGPLLTAFFEDILKKKGKTLPVRAPSPRTEVK